MSLCLKISSRALRAHLLNSSGLKHRMCQNPRDAPGRLRANIGIWPLYEFILIDRWICYLPARPRAFRHWYPPGWSSSPTILSGSFKSRSMTVTRRPSRPKTAAMAEPRMPDPTIMTSGSVGSRFFALVLLFAVFDLETFENTICKEQGTNYTNVLTFTLENKTAIITSLLHHMIENKLFMFYQKSF